MAQHREYNARPHVLQREEEYRRGPVGYPMQVIKDAVRSVRARLRHLFFKLICRFSTVATLNVVSWSTKSLRPPETRRCVQSSRSSLNATWRRLAAALNSTVLWSAVQRAATPCLSIGVQKSQLTPSTSSHTYRINPAVIDYRPASGNVQVLRT